MVTNCDGHDKYLVYFVLTLSFHLSNTPFTYNIPRDIQSIFTKPVSLKKRVFEIN